MFAISLSFFVALALLGAKFYSYSITLSSAILSDALESIINVVAAAFAMISVWFASQPPDREHPYGHGKIEYFSAGFEGALIIIAAIGIFKSGISHILNPQEISNLKNGLAILTGAGAVNLILGFYLLHIGKKTNSLILIADGRHVIADVYTTASVIIGLFVVNITGLLWLDGAVACLVGVHILFSGTSLVRHSFSGLMDTSDPELLEEITGLLSRNRTKWWMDIHNLRAFRSGELIHIDMHLVLPGYFSLEKAHKEALEIEGMINRHFKGKSEVLVHMDPCDDPDCPDCGPHVCDEKIDRLARKRKWSATYLTMPWRKKKG